MNPSGFIRSRKSESALGSLLRECNTDNTRSDELSLTLLRQGDQREEARFPKRLSAVWLGVWVCPFLQVLLHTYTGMSNPCPARLLPYCDLTTIQTS